MCLLAIALIILAISLLSLLSLLSVLRVFIGLLLTVAPILRKLLLLIVSSILWKLLAWLESLSSGLKGVRVGGKCIASSALLVDSEILLGLLREVVILSSRVIFPGVEARHSVVLDWTQGGASSNREQRGSRVRRLCVVISDGVSCRGQGRPSGFCVLLATVLLTVEGY